MSAKRNAQNWYQIHKSRSGDESVENSKEVAEAQLKVRELELQMLQSKVGASDTVLSGVRRLFFGRNAQEERVHQAESALKDAQSNASQAVRDARVRGERAYASDWASRNPDKAK